MPSLRVLLLSIALAIVAVSPTAASALEAHQDLSQLARRMPAAKDMVYERDLAAPAALARRESRQDAAERVRLAKSRAARALKVKRAVPECFPQGVTTPPAHGTYRNSAFGCKLVCFKGEGYRVSGSTCVPITPTTTCDGALVYDGTLVVGTHRVTDTGACKLVCYKTLGYSVSGGVCKKVIDITSDPTACGPTHQVCLAGYPSGAPACVGGVCTITCASGTPTPVPGGPLFTCS